MICTRRRVPGQRHFSALEFLQLEPQEFLQYWDVSYDVMARICCCSPRTVRRWFSRTDYYPPSPLHKYRLAIVHQIWLRI